MTTAIGNGSWRTNWIEAAFGGLGLAMLTTDRTGIITLINDKACRILGLKAEEVMGKALTDVIGLWDSKENSPMDLPLAQVMEKGLKISAEQSILMDVRTGRHLGVAVMVAPLRDEVGKVLGTLITMGGMEGNGKQKAAAGRTSTGKIPETEARQHQAIYVRHGGRYIRVLIDELLWVEAMENYVQLQTTKEKLVVHVTMKNIAEALSSKGYQRIHRSYIVKLSAIESIEENHVVIHGTALPIGKSYRAELLNSLTLI